MEPNLSLISFINSDLPSNFSTFENLYNKQTQNISNRIFADTTNDQISPPPSPIKKKYSISELQLPFDAQAPIFENEFLDRSPIDSKKPLKSSRNNFEISTEIAKITPEKCYPIRKTPNGKHIKVHLSPSVKDPNLRGVVYEFVRFATPNKSLSKEKRYVGYSYTPQKRIYNHIAKVYPICKKTLKKEEKKTNSLYRDMATIMQKDPNLLEKKFGFRIIYKQKDSFPRIEHVERDRYLHNKKTKRGLYNLITPSGTGPLSMKEFTIRSEQEKIQVNWKKRFPIPPTLFEMYFVPSAWFPVSTSNVGSLQLMLPIDVADFRGDVVYVWKGPKGKHLIGITNNLQSRLIGYLDNSNPDLLKAAQKNQVLFGIIGTVDELGFGLDRKSAERAYITFYDSYQNGYNQNSGGGGGFPNIGNSESNEMYEKNHNKTKDTIAITVSKRQN